MSYSVSCINCGYEKLFFGGHATCLDRDELASRAQTGEFGSVVKYLLSDKCALDVTVRNASHLSRCEYCSAPIIWESVHISYPEEDHILSLELRPEECPYCEADFIENPSLFTVEIPSRYDLLGWLFEMSDRPCPKCGEWCLSVGHE